MITVKATGISVRLVGVTFVNGYPENLHRLAELSIDAAGAGEPLAAILVRDPANEHDPNAIQVHVPSSGGRIGSIPRQFTPLLAASLDQGDRWQASVTGVAIDDDHPDRPGIEILITPVGRA